MLRPYSMLCRGVLAAYAQVVGSLGQFRMRRFPSVSVAQVRVAGTPKTVLCDSIL